MGEVERATWEISCRNCDRTKPGEVIPESPPNGFLISRAVAFRPLRERRKKSLEGSVALSWDLAQVHRTVKCFPTHV